MLALVCIVLVSLLTGLCEEQFCSIDDAESCKGNEEQKSLYTKATNERYQKYLVAIQEAEKNYKECNNTRNGCFKNVIKRDLHPFRKEGINKKLIDITATSLNNRGTWYQIIRGKLYRARSCMFPARCAGIEHFLLKIVDTLPDMDLVINTGDIPQSRSYDHESFLRMPVFSFSKTAHEYYDIMYPAWTFWEGGPAISLYPRGLGRWDQHRKSLNKASSDTPWEKKESKAFFRGSRTSNERDNLILLSRSKPHLVDAQYTKNQAWKSMADTLNATPATEVSLEAHCRYKYLFNFRGVAASFRHKHLFLCRSLVFHVGDEWAEFYYYAMKPWIHYVPVATNADQEELEDLIEFAKNNDDLARKIATRGRNFIWENLKMSDVMYYWKQLLKNYAKLLTYKTVLNDDFMEISKKDKRKE